MEYLLYDRDKNTVTVRFDGDEIIDLQQVLNSVVQEYESLDVEILNLSRDEVRALKEKLFAVTDHYRRGPA